MVLSQTSPKVVLEALIDKKGLGKVHQSTQATALIFTISPLTIIPLYNPSDLLSFACIKQPFLTVQI